CMKFIEIPTEQTTAITDAILALLALGCVLYLLQIGQNDPWKAGLWAWTFGLLALAAGLGAIAHGFQMSATISWWFWHPINLALGLVVALFVVGVIYDWRGLAAAQRVAPIMVAVGLLFFGATVFFSNIFLVFILYEAAAMLFALGVYGWLAVTGQLPGAGWMAAGVLATIIAAVVQASWNGKENPLILIWQFDQNGLYHLIQMIGVVLLLIGLRAALLTGGSVSQVQP
ncbi:MAG: hypothetical protein HYR94_25400, partial [Chloroflexi bacterium]|nr:hypothetical protein [Chloroflexota bacterium]